MKKLFAVLAALVMLASVITPAGATTHIFSDTFNSGFAAWIQTLTGGGVLSNPVQSTCDDRLPAGRSNCMTAYSGPVSNTGVAHLKHVFAPGEVLDNKDFGAEWVTYLQTLTDNGTIVGLFNLKDAAGNPVFVLQANPEGTQQSIRIGCKKDDGTFVYSVWSVISPGVPGADPGGPYKITVHWSADIPALCSYEVVHIPTGMGMASPYIPTFTSDSLSYASATIGITSVSSGMRYKTWNDDFVSFQNYDVNEPYFSDYFESSLPLEQVWDSTFWGGFEWNPGIPPFRVDEFDCQFFYSMSGKCAEMLVPRGTYSSGLSLQALSPTFDTGGFEANWRFATSIDAGNQFTVFSVWSTANTELMRVEFRGVEYPNNQARIMCKDNNNNWIVDGADGWISIPFHDRDKGIIYLGYRFEPSGYCWMRMFDHITQTVISNTYIPVDNGNLSPPSWLEFGLENVPITNGYDTYMIVDDFNLFHTLP